MYKHKPHSQNHNHSKSYNENAIKTAIGQKLSINFKNVKIVLFNVFFKASVIPFLKLVEWINLRFLLM